MNKVVEGTGNPCAKLMLVGESPGEVEEREGKPFMGPAGDVLNQLLADVGIKREDCWIDNVMHTRPPGNDFGYFYEDKQRNTPKEELRNGIQRLHEIINRINPDVVVCLGAESLRAVTDCRGIDKYRGFPLKHQGGLANVIGTYHPAYILRKWDGYATAKLDLGRAKEILAKFGKRCPIPAYAINYQPSFGQCMSFLEGILIAQTPLAFDIEFSKEMIDCIGFSNSEGHAFTIPFAQDGGDGNYWSEMQEQLLWEKIKEVLESDVPKIGQNISYEIFQLMSHRRIRIQGIQLDTMIAFNLMYPGQPKSLDYLSTVYTYLPFWGEAPKILGPERWKYNCMDALVTKYIARLITDDLVESGHAQFYLKLPHLLLNPLTSMSLRGIRIDRDLRNHWRAQYRKRLDRLKRFVNKCVPYEDIIRAQDTIKSLKVDERGILNPGSDTQLRNLFYTVWRMRPILERGTKQPKVDESALRKLARVDKRRYSRFFGLLLTYNKLDKIYNTYLSAEIGRDGRMRCSYNIAGTVTGRLSSSAAPDGTGTNLQNQPPSMRRMFLADEGQVMVQCDLKQAENRVVAYLANEPRMIQAFEEGADIHKRIAAMILRKPESEITKAERQLGKKIGHASNYGMGVDRFREVCWEELHLPFTREEAKRLQNQYFDAFPRIRMWHLEIQEQLNKNRTLTTPHGRKRYFFERWGPDLFKEAYAFVPQSTIVDTINLGLIKLHEAGFDLLLQVHDSVNLNAPAMTQELYEHLTSLLEVPFVINGHRVVIPIEITVGPNWGELKEWTKTVIPFQRKSLSMS